MNYDVDLHRYSEIIESTYPEIGRKLYQYFDAANKAFFGGSLPVVLMTFEILPYGAKIGTLTTSTNHLRIFTNRQQISEDSISIMVHEMIHLNHIINYPDWEKHYKGSSVASSHNNKLWIEDITRISAQLGKSIQPGLTIQRRDPSEVIDLGNGETKKIYGKNRKVTAGDMSLKEIATWPHTVPELDKKLFEFLTASIKSLSLKQELGFKEYSFATAHDEVFKLNPELEVVRTEIATLDKQHKINIERKRYLEDKENSKDELLILTSDLKIMLERKRYLEDKENSILESITQAEQKKATLSKSIEKLKAGL